MSEDRVALVPLRDASERVQGTVLGCVSLAGMVGIASLITSPVTALWAIAALTGAVIAAATIPWRRRRDVDVVEPEDIADPELRDEYCELLLAHHELAAMLLAQYDRPLSLLDRSRETVLLCGHVARSANHVYAYLARHDAAAVGVEATRLLHCAADPADVEAARMFASAAGARQRQLAAVLELRAIRARVQARVELATASLHAAIAGLVKRQALDEESLALAGETIAEHADDLATELAALVAADAVCAQ